MDTYTGAGYSQSGKVGQIFGYGSPDLQLDQATNFAVVDLETSGGSPAAGRVIEIAIVTMNTEGQVLEEFSTLINPEDGVAGATFVHHISPPMLEGAPTFSDLEDDITSRLQGNVVVAHHAAFEEGFLSMEFSRLGNSGAKFRAIDTLQLFPRVLQLPNYKLGTIFAELGIGEDEHTALGDTRGLATALSNFLPHALGLGYPIELGEVRTATASPRVWQRVTNLRKGQEGWMANLLRKLPLTSYVNEPFEKTLYFELLADVLADKKITGEEIKQIAKFAGQFGMSRDYIQGLNREFFTMAKATALADGILTNDEAAHLEACQRLLALKFD